MRVPFLVCAFLVLVGVSFAYDNSLSLNADYTVHWKVANESIFLLLEVKTLGWVGFGLGEPTSGSMPGADIVTGYVDNNGIVEIEDRHATKFGLPTEDDCQDWSVVGGNKTNGKTFLELSRLLATQDRSDRPIVEGLTRVLFAYGTDDDTEVSYHNGNRGLRSIEFIPSSNPKPPVPVSALTYDFVFDNIHLPPKATTYLCKSFVFPTISSSKAHIIRFDPIVDPRNPDLTHHMLVRTCPENSQEWDKYNNNGSECSLTPLGKKRQDISAYCVDFIYTWAVGMGPIIMPPQAGYAFGDGITTRILIQMHYSNPNQYKDRYDSSGFKITYITEDLRSNDVGILVLGDSLTYLPQIPPQQTDVEYETTCPEECTSKWAHEINVFADMLHMHFLGKKMWTNQWRDGKLVKEINGVEYFNYDLQQMTEVQTVIKPGDRLNTHCVFDSTKRTNATKFGPASTDEMCMDFVMYYPKFDFLPFCGYFVNESTVCEFPGGDPFHPDMKNPSVPDPADMQRNGEWFGEPCDKSGSSNSESDSSSETDTPLTKKGWFIAVMVIGGVLIAAAATGIAVIFFIRHRNQKRAGYGSLNN